MSQERIKDLRPIIENIEQADQIMAEIARVEVNITLIEARAEQRIANIKHDTALATEPHTELLKSLKVAMATFIDQNRSLFKSPRKRKTPSGSYGLQVANELVISDAGKLIEEILERGYDDCLKIVRTPVKPAITTRIKAGESFPGCTILSGDTAVCSVHKAILDNAKKEIN